MVLKPFFQTSGVKTIASRTTCGMPRVHRSPEKWDNTRNLEFTVTPWTLGCTFTVEWPSVSSWPTTLRISGDVHPSTSATICHWVPFQVCFSKHPRHSTCSSWILPRPSRDLSKLFSKEQHDLPDKLHLGKPRGFGPFTKRLANQMDVHSSEVVAICFVQSHMGQ